MWGCGIRANLAGSEEPIVRMVRFCRTKTDKTVVIVNNNLLSMLNLLSICLWIIDFLIINNVYLLFCLGSINIFFVMQFGVKSDVSKNFSKFEKE